MLFRSDKMPWAEVMNDYLILASTSTTDVPATWDQTTYANLGGTPPNFAFHVQHKDRMWAAGVSGQLSRLYYSASGNHADWVGAGSGAIDVAPTDGDILTAIASHKNELIVFKGRSRRSIFRITGSAPTGADAFAMVPFIKGVGAANLSASTDQPITPLKYRAAHVYRALELWCRERKGGDPVAETFKGEADEVVLRARQVRGPADDRPSLRPMMAAYRAAASWPYSRFGARRSTGGAAWDQMDE